MTSIEWTDATWNPVTGCSKVSPGCAHCYAEGIAFRGLGRFGHKYAVPSEIQPGIMRRLKFTEVQCHEDALDAPLHWRKPKRIFVNSMSDLFHEDVPDSFIDRVFAVMALAPQHTFQILTKRAERMRGYLSSQETLDRIADVLGHHYGRDKTARAVLGQQFDVDQDTKWPLLNVWLGVSVENQHFADERIPLLLDTPSAVRFISAEPLLGPITAARWLRPQGGGAGHCFDIDNQWWHEPGTCTGPICLGQCCGRGLDWVIVGGESGPSARPCFIEWIRGVVNQCQSAAVPVFCKQLGSFSVYDAEEWVPANKTMPVVMRTQDGQYDRLRLSDRKGGDPSQWPEDLRVREYPEVRA